MGKPNKVEKRAVKKPHVRKGDQVLVISGKAKGQQGAVLRVRPEKGQVVVEKVNMIKRHTKPTQTNPQGGIVEKEGAINISNVMLWCTKCNQASRVKRAELNDGKVVRVCRECGEMFLR